MIISSCTTLVMLWMIYYVGSDFPLNIIRLIVVMELFLSLTTSHLYNYSLIVWDYEPMMVVLMGSILVT